MRRPTREEVDTALSYAVIVALVVLAGVAFHDDQDLLAIAMYAIAVCRLRIRDLERRVAS